MNNRLLYDEVLNWFGDDSPEEIASYITGRLNDIVSGTITVEELIKMIKESSDE